MQWSSGGDGTILVVENAGSCLTLLDVFAVSHVVLVEIEQLLHGTDALNVWMSL